MFRFLALSALLLTGASAAGIVYYTAVTVPDIWDAGTNNKIAIRYIGENSVVSAWYGLDRIGWNDFKKDRVSHFEHTLDADIGQVSLPFKSNVLTCI